MLTLELTIPKEAEDLLRRIPLFLKAKALDKSLGALARTVNTNARPLMPNSNATGTRKKWSNKYKNNPRWQIESGRLLSHKVHKLPEGALVYLGPKFDEGNKQKFNAPTRSGDSRVHFLWGKPGQSYQRSSSRTRPHTVTRVRAPMVLTFPFKNRAMQRAWDSTKDQAIEAFVSALKQSFEQDFK